MHAQLLAAAGATMESVGNMEGAEASYKQSLNEQPDQFMANYGMGKMFYNHGYDKLKAIEQLPLDDEEGVAKLTGEYQELWRQSIPYFNNAISFIDHLDEEGQGANRANLYHCLNALNTVYARLEMYDELKPIKARIDELQKFAQ